MKLSVIAMTCVLAGTFASAQDHDKKSATRIVVEDGDEVTLTGCVARTPEGSYSLTNAAGKKGSVGTYMLAATDDDDHLDDLEKHLGHRVEIEGKAADKGKGKIQVFTRSEAPKGDGSKAKTQTRAEMKGDLAGLPFLGIKSLRMLASVCP